MRNGILLTGSLLAMALLVAACGGEKQAIDNGGGNPAGEQPSKQQEPAKPVKLSVLVPADGTYEWFMERYGTAIQEKYPQYSFEVIPNVTDALQKIVTNKSQLDLILTSFVGLRGQVLPMGLMADMSDLIKKHSFDTGRIEEAYLHMIRNLDNGNLSALPLYNLQMSLVYNKDIFDQFGVPYPKDGMKWEELYDTAKRLTREESGIQYYGFLNTVYSFIPTNQYSLNFVDPTTMKANLQTDRVKAYAESLGKLFMETGYKPKADLLNATNVANLQTKDKRVAMWNAFHSGAGAYNQANLNWDIISLPVMHDLPGIGSQPYPVYLAVSSTSKYRDEAFQVIAHVLTDDVQTKLSANYAQITPLVKQDVKAAFGRNVAEWKGKNVNMVTALKPALPPAYVGEYQGIAESAVANGIQAYMTGTKDINTALREAEEVANKQIAEKQAAKK